MAAVGSKMLKRHMTALKGLEGKKVEAGWFESDRYPAPKDGGEGVQVARIARFLETGGTIQNPGGTKYINDAVVKGRFVGTRFVKNDFPGKEDGVTKAHSITIPARPFMRLAAVTFKSTRAKVQAKIATQLASGKIQPDQALGMIGAELENCIVKSMKNGGWVANAPSTVSKKGFDKPLIDDGTMLKTVSSKVS